jgi:hypothetical protein
MRQGALHSARRRDLGLVILGLVATVGGVLAGWSAPVLATLILGLPVVGFLLAGHLSGRGAVVGCVALALGSTLIRPTPGTIPWAELLVLGGLAAAAVFVGSYADQLAGTPRVATDAGRWVSIMVECEGPTGPAEVRVRPRVSPRRDPERRSLFRRVATRGWVRTTISKQS